MLKSRVNSDMASKVRLLSVRNGSQHRTGLTNSIYMNHNRHMKFGSFFRLQSGNHNFIRFFRLKNYVLNKFIQSSGQNVSSLRDKLFDNMMSLTKILQKQSNVYITLRLRQFGQSIDLYHRLYSPHEFRKVFFGSFFKRFDFWSCIQSSHSKFVKYIFKGKRILLSVASFSAFSWNTDGITDKEFADLINEFLLFEKAKRDQDRGSLNIENNQIENCPKSSSDQHSFMIVNCLEMNKKSLSDWEVVINRPHFNVWRKTVGSTYEYKAYSFYSVQKDLDFRKEWDNLVLKLNIIDKESIEHDKFNVPSIDDSGNELVHWIMKYPYPMKSREYVYIRRSKLDYDRKYIILISRSARYPRIPETTDHVRVNDYLSQMIIKPHSDNFLEPGFDYMLTYFDNPRASFPSPAYNWMASRGVPDFVEQLHQAAIQISQTKLKDLKQTNFGNLAKGVEENTDENGDRESIDITYFNIDFKVKFKDKKLIFEKRIKNSSQETRSSEKKNNQTKDKDYTPSFESLSIIW